MAPITRPARTAIALTAGTALALVLSACAAGPNDAVAGTQELAGFWLGLWQGLISPVTFLVSLFNNGVSIYEIHNNGGWYDFGFMLGVSIVFSGGPLGNRARSRSAKKSDRA
jgi:hypothetical protein